MEQLHLFVRHGAPVHLLCLIFLHGQAAALPFKGKGNGISRAGHAEMGAGQRDLVLAEGDGQRADTGFAGCRPGEGKAPDDPGGFRVQPVVLHGIYGLVLHGSLRRKTGIDGGPAPDGVQGPCIDMRHAAKLKVQGVVKRKQHSLFGGQGCLLSIQDGNIPFRCKCLQRRGLNSHAQVEHQATAAQVKAGDTPSAAGPFKLPVQGQLLCGAPLAPAVEAAVEKDAPWLRRAGGVGVHVGVVEIFGIGDFAVVKGALQLLQGVKGVLHGAKSGLPGKARQQGFLFLRRRIFLKICRKLLLIPLPCLFGGSRVPAGQEQPQKIRKAACQGMHKMRRQVHGADGKHRLPKAPDKAKMDAVHPGLPDDACATGGAEVREEAVGRLKAKGRKVQPTA